MKSNLTLFFILGALLFSNWYCQKVPNVDKVATYLHLSHTRTEADDTIDSLLLEIDYNKFEMLWLGGDLTYYTSRKEKTLKYVDTIFDVKNAGTLWALGNHDYENRQLVEKYTHRPPYYSCHRNGITFLVLDTQDSLSHIVGAQEKLFKTVTDTIEASSHLVILHHKLIWLYGNPNLVSQIPTVSNAGLGDCFVCLNPNNFYTDLYPELIKVKRKGIEVLCIGGDIGTKIKNFEYKTSEGIHFLASGIESGESGNKALIFIHDLSDKKLDWAYQLISDL